MKNLKRALSLALASVMVLGLMMVGAGAASFDSFSDKDKVVNVEAVSILNNLNVINGKDDGSFDPTGIVTRAEMAKMICVVLNGGKDPQLGSVTSNTYTDTAANWAAGYIEYCTTLKIVSGDGTGKFNPTNTVTGSEAAKMLLVAMGYDADYAKFTGGAWATSVDVSANTKGLYDGLNINPSEGLTRDNAAQMVYNALNAKMVQYDYAIVPDQGTVTAIANVKDRNVSLLNDKFKAVRVEGVVMANEVADLNGDDKSLDTGKTKVAISNYDELEEAMTSPFGKTSIFEVSSDMNVLGKAVILYAKPSTVAPGTASKATVIGSVILDEGNNTVVVDSSKDDLVDVADDNGLSLIYKGKATGESKETLIARQYGNMDSTSTIADKTAAEKDSVRGVERTLIDNDGDGEVEIVLYTTYEFGKVTKYSTKDDGSITVRVGSGSWNKDDKDDVVGFDDVEKDDYVLAAKIGGKLYVEKAKSVTGNLDRYKSGTSLTVDGTVYNVSGVPIYKDSDLTSSDPGTYTNTGNEATFYLDKAGNVVAVGDSEESAGDYAFVVGFSDGDKVDTARAKVILSDGTTGTYYVNKVQKWDTADKGKWVDQTINTTLAKAMPGTLVIYSINTDDEITLKIPADGGQIGKDLTFDALDNSHYVFEKGKTSVVLGATGTTNYYANGSTVFFYTKENETKADVYTGNKNAPSVKFDASPSTEVTDYQVIKDGSTIKAIVVNDVTAAAAGDYVYLYNYNGGNSDVSNFDAIVNGEIKEDIAVNESGWDKAKYGLYEFTTNVDEEYDLTSVHYKDEAGHADSSYVRGVVEKISGDSIYIGGDKAGNEFILTSDSVVALIDESKTALGETVEKGDYVVAIVDDKEVTAVFIAEAFNDDDLSLTVKSTFDSSKANLTIVIDDDTITLGGANKATTTLSALMAHLDKGSDKATVSSDQKGNLKADDEIVVESESGDTSKTYKVVIEA